MKTLSLKKTVSALGLFVLLTMGLSACGSKKASSENGEESYQVAWENFVAAAEAKKCRQLKKMSTERVALNDNDCQEIYVYLANEPIEANWDNVEWEERGENAKIRVYNAADEASSTLTLLRREKGEWKIDSVFWR